MNHLNSEWFRPLSRSGNQFYFFIGTLFIFMVFETNLVFTLFAIM